MIEKVAETSMLIESLRRAKGKGARTQPDTTNDKPGVGGMSGGEGAGVTPMGTGQLAQVE